MTDTKKAVIEVQLNLAHEEGYSNMMVLIDMVTFYPELWPTYTEAVHDLDHYND